MTAIVDLFAGPGGWSQGLRLLGLRGDVGIECDRWACLTRAAAGHTTIQADVAAYPVGPLAAVMRGLIASPPCTMFSAAGKGTGRRVLDLLAGGIRRLFTGEDCRAQVWAAVHPVALAEREAANAKRKPDKRWTRQRVEAAARADTDAAVLVLEPARFIAQALAAGGVLEWVALEQVPPVLPLWHVYRDELTRLGWSVWAAVVNAADHGVPQTRRRAVLAASRTRTVHPPEPTHAKTARTDAPGLRLPQWVSMAEALCRAEAEHPAAAGTVDDDGSAGGGLFTVCPRESLCDERAEGRWVLRHNALARATVRGLHEPAGTLFFGHARGEYRWMLRNGTNTNVALRGLDQPAGTLFFGARVNTISWVLRRPATTVCATGRPSPPGHRYRGPGSASQFSHPDAVRISVREAGILQSFPADYPWQGTVTKQFQQVGNAIPPLLAAHVLAAATGLPFSSPSSPCRASTRHEERRGVPAPRRGARERRLRRREATVNGPRIGSLFTGTGALDLAVMDVYGGEVVWHSQYEPPDKKGRVDTRQHAARILAHRWPGVPNLGDITAVDWQHVLEEHGPIDVLTGGFPCTDVSSAGLRAGLAAGTRSGLWSHMALAVSVLRPRLVVIENVEGLLSARADRGVGPTDQDVEAAGDHALRALGCVLGDLADLGIDTEWLRLGACDVGAPHRRRRVIVLGRPAVVDPDGLRRWHPGLVDGLGAAQRDPQAAADATHHGCQGSRAARGGGSGPADRDLLDADADRGRRAGHGELPARRDTVRPRVRQDADGRDTTAADTERVGLQGERRHPGTDSQRQTPAELGRRPAGSGHLAGDDESLRRRTDVLALRPGRPEVDWGPYEAAIRRWEHVLGRPAPWPTDLRGRLSPVFSEWMMGYPDGWVTCVPGLPRSAMLQAIGNGVVRLQVSTAVRMLHHAFAHSDTGVPEVPRMVPGRPGFGTLRDAEPSACSVASAAGASGGGPWAPESGAR